MKTRFLAAFLLLCPVLASAQDDNPDQNLSRVDIGALVRQHDDSPSVPGVGVGVTEPETSVAGGAAACDSADCFGQRAFNEHNAGDLASAMRDCDAALKLEPSHAGVLQVRAMVYTDQGDYDRGLADIQKAIKSAPTDGLNFYLRGVIRFDMKEYEKTIDDETKAIALAAAEKDYEAEAYNERAAAYGILKQDDQSMTDLNKSLALAESPEAYADRALLYARMGEYPRSISDAGKAVALKPSYANAYGILGAVYFETDQYAKALSSYQKNSDMLGSQVAARKTPGQDQEFFLSAPYTGMAACQLRLGDKDQAAADYKKAIALDPVWSGGIEAVAKKMPSMEFLPKGKAANQELVKLVAP